MTTALELWNDQTKVAEIRKVFAPKLNETEFHFFVGLGKSLGANPFTREIWAVKYKESEPATIFCGRDYYRKKAQELKEYNGHTVDVVYSKDTFKVSNGVPDHSYSMIDRGVIVGAYCVVHKKNTSVPYFVFVNISEYKKGSPTWNSIPATMIKKVAEAQALRGAFQGTFAGTYDESEEAAIIETKGLPEITDQHEPEEQTEEAEYHEIIGDKPAGEIPVLPEKKFFVESTECINYKKPTDKDGETTGVRYGMVINKLQYGTFSRTIYEIANACILNNTPIVFESKTKPNGKVDIITISPAK